MSGLETKRAELIKNTEHNQVENKKLIVGDLNIDYEELQSCLKSLFSNIETIKPTMIPLCRLQSLLWQIIINKIVLKHQKPNDTSDAVKEKIIKRLELFRKESTIIIEELINSGNFTVDEKDNSIYKIII